MMGDLPIESHDVPAGDSVEGEMVIEKSGE
jgi:hypothetical protein